MFRYHNNVIEASNTGGYKIEYEFTRVKTYVSKYITLEFDNTSKLLDIQVKCSDLKNFIYYFDSYAITLVDIYNEVLSFNNISKKVCKNIPLNFISYPRHNSTMLSVLELHKSSTSLPKPSIKLLQSIHNNIKRSGILDEKDVKCDIISPYVKFRTPTKKDLQEINDLYRNFYEECKPTS